MTGFKTGVLKLAQAYGVGQYPGMLGIQPYMPIMARRELEDEEQREVDKYSQRLIPKIWRSDQTPLTQLLYSHKKRAIVPLAAGTLVGSLIGSALGKSKGRFGRGAMGAAIGASVSLPVAAIEYFKHRAINESNLEALRRLPVNATIRDLKSDPVYQKEQDILREASRGKNYFR